MTVFFVDVLVMSTLEGSKNQGNNISPSYNHCRRTHHLAGDGRAVGQTERAHRRTDGGQQVLDDPVQQTLLSLNRINGWRLLRRRLWTHSTTHGWATARGIMGRAALRGEARRGEAHLIHPRLRPRPTPDRLVPRPADSSPNPHPAPGPTRPEDRSNSHLHTHTQLTNYNNSSDQTV